MTDFFKNLLSNGELQEENERLKEEINQLHNGRNPEELYTLFGKPIRYWEELKAENDRLKEEIKEVKKYQYEQEYLEKEIETAKVNLDIGKEEARHYLHEAYKFQKCLQEIKAIAEEYLTDCQGFKCEAMEEIMQKITKAEEE